MGYSALRGVVLQAGAYVVSATVASTATGANGKSGTVSCPGVLPGDVVFVAPVAAQTAGVAFNAAVTAADTIVITAMNGSAGTYNPGAQSFNVLVLRPKVA
jgi:hypothetical protein